MPRLIAAVLALAALAPPVAHAGAPPRVTIPEGTWIRLFDLGSADAWYPHRDRLSDLVCRVGPGALSPQAATWFDGHVHCLDGKDYTFFQATFQVLNTLAATTDGCPAGSWTGGTVSDGAEVRVLALSDEDGFAGQRADIVGLHGHVAGELLPEAGSCWMSGEFIADDGRDFYFYQAAVGVDSLPAPTATPMVPAGTPEPPCPDGAFTGASLPEGSRVQVLAIHPDDAYWDVRAQLEGVQGLVHGDLHNNTGTCWFGGGFTSDAGEYSYFYKAAIRLVEESAAPAQPTCPEGVATGATIPKGHRVKIVEVHPDDAYYSTRFEIVGKTGTVGEALEQTGDCWYAGSVVSDDGDQWYFFRASVVDLGVLQ